MMIDMLGDIVTTTEKRCETCNEVREILYSHGGFSSTPCKCVKELFNKMFIGTSNNDVFIGNVEDRYKNELEIFHDVYIPETHSYLTDELYKLEGKKVRVVVEVIS